MTRLAIPLLAFLAGCAFAGIIAYCDRALRRPTEAAAPDWRDLRKSLDQIEQDAGWIHDNSPDYSPDGVATLRDIAREIAKEAYRARESLGPGAAPDWREREPDFV